MFNRLILLDKNKKNSFFLWGPRQSGKSTLLHQTYPEAFWVDLLRSEQFLKYRSNPRIFREEVMALPQTQWVVVDEIQSVPLLLNEIHWLIENQNRVFALCGSSARKLRRDHANMLGGRAIRFELLGLCSQEIGHDFNLERILNHGYLPSHYTMENPLRRMKAYIGDYLKEEIAAEGLTRNLSAFSDFLRSAVLGDTEVLSYTTVARDCGVSADTVKNYYQILTDTLLARLLPAFTKRQKRKVTTMPKFYFFDVGLVNLLSQRGNITLQGEMFGKAFENWVFHELNCYRIYREKDFDLTYWRLASKTEVDFILGDMEVAVEVKGTSRIHQDHLKGLRTLVHDHPEVKKRIVVSTVDQSRTTEDGIAILNYADFLSDLWSGKVLA